MASLSFAALDAALDAGWYLLNRRSYERDDFAGQSWIISPEGEVLAETTAEAPVATVSIDLDEATAAKQTYPRNLPQEG